jgi:hypothetical protein
MLLRAKLLLGRRYGLCLRTVSFANFENRGLDSLKNLKVTGAAAQIAGKGFTDLIASGARIAVQQGFGGYQDAWSAITALRGAEIGKSVLQWMELALRCEALNRKNVFVIAFEGEQEARKHWLAAYKNRAGAAFAQFAAVFRAGVA